MKLTAKQIKQLIKEELQKVLEGRFTDRRTIIAPGPVYDDKAKDMSKPPSRHRYASTPIETGSTIVYDNPYDLLDPQVQQAIPMDSATGSEAHSQAYELQRAIDPDFDDSVPEDEEEDEQDFLDAIELSQKDPVQKALSDLRDELEKYRVQKRNARSSGASYDEIRKITRKGNAIKIAIAKLESYKSDPYGPKRPEIISTDGERIRRSK